MLSRWSVLAFALSLLPGRVAFAQTEGTMGSWTAPFPWPVVSVHLQLLPNGKVLAWEKGDSLAAPGTSFAPAKLWDPQLLTFTDVSYTAVDLFCSGHSFLPDGRLFVTGGHFKDHVGIANTTIFDFNTNTWTPGPMMNAGRWYPGILG